MSHKLSCVATALTGASWNLGAVRIALSVIIGMTLVPSVVRADVVDFENLKGPPGFSTAGPAQTLTYTFADGVVATFNGGVILTNEATQTTDFTSVYATANFNDPTLANLTLANPLTVTFNKSIQNFQMQILNAIPGPYEMFDNNGNSVNFNLAVNGGSIATEGFAAVGTMVSIEYLGPPFGAPQAQWDFAIDNVTFNQPLTVGSPGPVAGAGLPGLILAGGGLLGWWRRKRKVEAAA